MIFLGNAASFHLQTWRNIYELCGEPVNRLYSIHPVRGDFPEEVTVAARSKFSGYFALGMLLRKLPSNSTIHAHGASGYGFSALLSGRRYIATIYGSEILQPQSFLYRRMMYAVLFGASAITVTSIAARDKISELDPKLEKKTSLFHTGVDAQQLAEVEARAASFADEKLRILLIRNAAPHYRTHQVLTAISGAIGDRDIDVFIPIGNGDRKYFDYVRSQFQDQRFIFIDRPLDRIEYLGLISKSDICVNFPKSDQVSATLLEALYFDKIIVTNRLDSYNELIDCAKYTGDWIIAEDDTEISNAIASAIDRVGEGRPRCRIGREIVVDQFSIRNAVNRFLPVLEHLK
ncbi:hypothetical protein [Sphingopyxis flava]|uniref:Uncharacterized protein n=1 Tax=Sphingopyxis flava TaxID=1507287 RepID=A0A1T5F609_9SPHN|nr:hypothetical protein [Sphingopyxis flava]SKB91602.1 hypothetical protein SAMN06295937_102910 [Sphingopyxis flava]